MTKEANLAILSNIREKYVKGGAGAERPDGAGTAADPIVLK